MNGPGLRVGVGTDFHWFAPGRPLILGGLELPGERGLLGHSDGDALLHALCDACLGAAGLEDIGLLFPDTDPTLLGLDSRQIAARVVALLDQSGFAIQNLDAVLEGREPRIAPLRTPLRSSIAALFGLDPGQVNVRGKSNEGAGPEGEGRAVRVTAVALLVRRVP